MEKRILGKTNMALPLLGLGGAPLGQEYGKIDLNEVTRTVHTALDLGVNFIDTSPYYGRGMSEMLLGLALRGVSRERYLLCSKLGRYDVNHFDFSARRVVESVDISLYRLGVDYLDICLCHDIEFVDMAQIVEETLPALRKVQSQGKVRFIGISGYPLKIFRWVLSQTELDVVLSYCHYTLQNRRLLDLVPFLQQHQVGIINASPFGARLLTNETLPPWHKAAPSVKEACARAADYCRRHGSDIAKLALQFAAHHPAFACCLAGSDRAEYVVRWVQWLNEPIDEPLLREVEAILQPVLNVGYVEGRAENN